MGQVLVVANPKAGRGRAVQRAEQCVAELRRAGVQCDLQTPLSPAATRQTVQVAVAEGVGAVIACGGDGTINTVVQPVVGSATAFAVLPSGTGNDIARSLGHGQRGGLDALLAKAIVSEQFRAVDVGRVEVDEQPSTYFVGVLSTGFDSTVNERANTMTRPSGTLKYLIAMLAELPGFTARDYQLVVDGVAVTGPGMLVSIGNGSSFGGGMRVCPDARLDDGLLDITWLGDVGTGEFLRVFPRVYRGTHVDHHAVRTMTGSVVEVQATGQVAYADGERIGPLPVTIRAVPGALRVLDLSASS